MNIKKLIDKTKEICSGKLDIETVKASFTSHKEYDTITVKVFYNKDNRLTGVYVKIQSDIPTQYNEEFLFKKLELELINKEPTSLNNYNI